MPEYICYCFRFTEDDINKDFEQHDRSTILEYIMKQKKEGGCRCADLNPRGR